MKSAEKALVQSEEEIFQYFENLERKAQELNPGIIDEIRDFNVNNVSLDAYSNYITAINQGPIAATTNSVSYAILGNDSKRNQ